MSEQYTEQPQMIPMFDKIAEALAKAQGEMQNAPLNKTNPHFKSKYADLAAIRDSVIPALSKHGVAVVQQTEYLNGELVLRTSLIHSSGQRIDSTYPLPIDKPQVMGSAITYAKRYCLAAMCGISADDDDDGNAAQDGQARSAPKASSNSRQAAPANNADAEWKADAERIKVAIDNAPTVPDVNNVIKAQTKALATIKENSQTAYEFLIDRAEKRRGVLAQAPADEPLTQDDIPLPDPAEAAE